MTLRPWLSNIRHYYGDTVRAMFLAAAIIYAVSMPLIGNLLPLDTFSGIFMVLFLVLLAGFTNPHLKLLMLVNVLVAAAGMYLMQSAAIEFLYRDSGLMFFLRQGSAILFLFAFYDGIKTLRSMLLGQIGAEPSVREFDKKK